MRRWDFGRIQFGLKFFAAATVILGTAINSLSLSSPVSAQTKYPETKKLDVVDDYHGTKVADPYRWLENPDSQETKAWVDAQNKVTISVLDSIAEREKIRTRLSVLWNFEKYTPPVKRGKNYFYEYNNGLQNQSVLYVTEADRTPRQLLDPNTLSKDGTINLAQWVPSDNGELLALGFGSAGSDWRRWKVMKVADGSMTDDIVEWSKFSTASWSSDNKGFFYSRYDTPKPGEEFVSSNFYQKIFYHQLGTKQEADQLVYKRDDEKDWNFDAAVSEDGKFLGITVNKGTLSQNQFFYKSLAEPNSQVVELLKGFDSEYLIVGNVGTTFYFLTDHKAVRRRLIAIDLDQPAEPKWKEIIPEGAEVATQATLVGNHFIVSYLKDARSVDRIYDLTGKFVRDVNLPGIGASAGYAGKSSDPETFFAFQTLTTPISIYRLNVVSGDVAPFKKLDLKYDPEFYETKQVFYPSKDGTKVPMLITFKKGTTNNKVRPTLLYGYGGFDISITPRFSVMNLAWVEMGGIYAVANLRGGGEYGREWHEAGMKEKKQNVFDDFIAAGEYLIAEGYTDRDHLGIYGRSNGGLLVGACMTQRPDLFGACLPAVGVMDMLRFQKFTIGHAWVSEFGSSDNPKEFGTLIRYSPLHNLKPGTKYPATMVMTADHDDRVVPAHSHKFAATLQAAQDPNGPPCVIRIETSGGHGAGKPISMQIAEAADMLGFLTKFIGGGKLKVE